jgi:hypothetical protein
MSQDDSEDCAILLGFREFLMTQCQADEINKDLKRINHNLFLNCYDDMSLLEFGPIKKMLVKKV